MTLIELSALDDVGKQCGLQITQLAVCQMHGRLPGHLLSLHAIAAVGQQLSAYLLASAFSTKNHVRYLTAGFLKLV